MIESYLRVGFLPLKRQVVSLIAKEAIMKNSMYSECIRSLAIILFLSVFVLVLAPISVAEKLSDEEMVCKLECNKEKSHYQQVCGKSFYSESSRLYKNVDFLVNCVQALSKRVEFCEKRCLGVRVYNRR